MKVFPVHGQDQISDGVPLAIAKNQTLLSVNFYEVKIRSCPQGAEKEKL
jgi:hypothetical protein